MYEYLTAVLIMGIIWMFLFIIRRDLRRAMVWSGTFYFVILTVGFFAHSLISNDQFRAITPGYWTPHTLFNLGQITNGYAIEDVLFMFFAAGIATALYEFCFQKKISEHLNKKLKGGHALLFGILVTLILHKIFYLNDMYLLIYFNFFGTLAIIYTRRDLIIHSLIGGLLFLVVYILGYLLLLQIFPNFIHDIYRLNFTSGIILLGIPLEEYLYALTFGMLWAPIYEYEHRYKDK